MLTVQMIVDRFIPEYYGFMPNATGDCSALCTSSRPYRIVGTTDVTNILVDNDNLPIKISDTVYLGFDMYPMVYSRRKIDFVTTSSSVQLSVYENWMFSTTRGGLLNQIGYGLYWISKTEYKTPYITTLNGPEAYGGIQVMAGLLEFPPDPQFQNLPPQTSSIRNDYPNGIGFMEEHGQAGDKCILINPYNKHTGSTTTGSNSGIVNVYLNTNEDFDTRPNVYLPFLYRPMMYGKGTVTSTSEFSFSFDEPFVAIQFGLYDKNRQPITSIQGSD